MKKYRTEFDEKIAAYSSNLSSAESVLNIVPGLDRKRIANLLKKNSILLGKMDSGKIKRPEILADSNGFIPDQMLANLDLIPSAAGDPRQFMTNVIAKQAEFNIRMEQAVGLAAKEIDDLRSDVAAEIESNLADSRAASEDVRELLDFAKEKNAEVEASYSKINALLEQASSLAERLDKVKGRFSEYNDDARRANSIDRLVNSIRKKVSSLEEELLNLQPTMDGVRNDRSESQTILEEVKLVSAELVRTNDKAKTTLGLASQAGLAKSYLDERKKIARDKLIYTGVFYAGILSMAIVAGWYVLPVFEKFLTSGGGNTDYFEKTLVLFVRSAVLAPFVWAIVFTSNRLKRLEVLEMDYAEKAAASLAYHGYKSEMDGDASLLQQLKSGLLVRFSEHPERLLRKAPPNTVIESNGDHFRVATESIENETPAQEQ